MCMPVVPLRGPWDPCMLTDTLLEMRTVIHHHSSGHQSTVNIKFMHSLLQSDRTAIWAVHIDVPEYVIMQ